MIWLVVAIIAVAWGLLAKRLGLFRRHGIVGPDHLAPGEGGGALLAPFFIGMGVWLVVPLAYQLVAHPDQAAPVPATKAVGTAPAPARVVKLSPAELAVLSTCSPLSAFLAVLAANVAFRREALRRLGLEARRFARGAGAGLVGLCAALPLVLGAMWVTEILFQLFHADHPAAHEMLEALGETPSAAVQILIVVSAAVVAPLFEELLFRGHLQAMLGYAFQNVLGASPAPSAATGPAVPAGLLTGTPPEGGGPGAGDAPGPALPYASPGVVLHRARKRARARWAAVAATSGLFALVHPWWTAPPIFVLSLCLGYAYERTGSLWAPIFLHAFFNSASLLYYWGVVMHHAG